ncbi:MAG: glycosyltransferase [Candidatus Rokubacteria bacterium]|nr:glycosyltransferase [Candidatus Rokubacteria bacterium]
MTRAAVSIILPTYNRALVVGDAIRSALAQTHADFELIVVDDGSTDETAEVLRAVADPRMVTIRGVNRGAAAARNAALAVVQGELVSFLDSDDLWKPDKLAAEVRFLDTHPEVHAVFSDVEKIDGDHFVPSFVRASAVFSRLIAGRASPDGIALSQREMFLVLLEEVPVLPTAFTIRTSAFDVVGSFMESWRSFSDWEFLVRFARRFRFGYIDRPVAIVRISSDSIHRVHAVFGRTAMLRLLHRERLRHAEDPEAAAAARRGIIRLRRHLGWSYARQGLWGRAAFVFLTGFIETGDAGLFLRALGALGPRGLREGARALLRRALPARA